METFVQRSPKRRKITDYFQTQPPNAEQQETELQQQEKPIFLRRYQPTSIPRCKHPVGRPQSQSRSDSVSQTQPESSQEPEEIQNKKPRGIYSLHQKLEIVKFARANSEVAASWRYRVAWSPICGWKDIDKEPSTKKVSIITKGIKAHKEGSRKMTLLFTRDWWGIAVMGATLEGSAGWCQEARHPV